MKAYNNWIKNLKNKGKEFRFEIDKDVDPDKAMPILDRIKKIFQPQKLTYEKVCII